MSVASPESGTVQTVSPPSYSPKPLETIIIPDVEDKFSVQPARLADDTTRAAANPTSENPAIKYEDGPEVVPDGAVPVEGKSKYLANEAEPMITPTKDKDRTTTMTPSNVDGPYRTASAISQGYTASPTMDVPVSGTTVTPLHLLGDQSDAIDCPFCQRRTETRVQQQHSAWTHVGAGALFLTTICGVAAPYLCHWCAHVNHYCQNCGRKVAYLEHGKKEMKTLGTPDHLRQISKYPTASPPQPRANK